MSVEVDCGCPEFPRNYKILSYVFCLLVFIIVIGVIWIDMADIDGLPGGLHLAHKQILIWKFKAIFIPMILLLPYIPLLIGACTLNSGFLKASLVIHILGLCPLLVMTVIIFINYQEKLDAIPVVSILTALLITSFIITYKFLKRIEMSKKNRERNGMRLMKGNEVLETFLNEC